VLRASGGGKMAGKTIVDGNSTNDACSAGNQSEVTAVLGTQWGDEGKGKIVDLLCQEADVVCRCQVRISCWRESYFKLLLISLVGVM